MRKIFAVLALALLAGCSAIQTATQPVAPTTAVALQDAAYKAKLGFQAALVVAVAYIERPRCGRPTSPALCSEQLFVDTMRRLITAADASTQAAEDSARAITGDTTVASALVDAAQRSVVALKTMTTMTAK